MCQIIYVTYSLLFSASTITGGRGPPGAPGNDGMPGPTGEKGSLNCRCCLSSVLQFHLSIEIFVNNTILT